MSRFCSQPRASERRQEGEGFLALVDEFRQDAQLLIVSHQKRTMEAADILYGVTMQPGGSSKVVSERVSTAAASH